MKFNSIILFSLLLLCGCVKNTISIHVTPNGKFDMIIHSHGDENDILDNDFPINNLLNNSDWIISSTIDSNNVDTHDFIAKRQFFANAEVPQNFTINNTAKIHPLLKHDIDVKYRNWILYKTYSVNILFHSREVEDKYPTLMNFIKNPESNYSGLMQEIFFYLFEETLLRSQIEFNQKAIIQKELNTWLQQEVATKTDSTIFEYFDDLKEEGLDLIMHPVNPDFYNEIDSIFNYLEKEYEITQKLIDDDFEIKIILPGTLEKSNHKEQNSDTLKWSFDLKDFMNSDYQIHASSKIIYQQRSIIAALLSLIILIILIIKKRI